MKWIRYLDDKGKVSYAPLFCGDDEEGKDIIDVDPMVGGYEFESVEVIGLPERSHE